MKLTRRLMLGTAAALMAVSITSGSISAQTKGGTLVIASTHTNGRIK